MKTPNQKQVWNAIAEEWDNYKKIGADATIDFLKKQSGNVLDLGSGSGRHLMKIPEGKMYLVDFSEKMIELAKKKAKKMKVPAEFAVADMTKLPYKDDFSDAAISISALHCLKPAEQKKAIKELYRVMKPKAKVFIGVWNKQSKRFKRAKTNEKLISWTDKGKRYYYLFSEDEIHNLFKEVGFKILETKNSEMMIRFVAER